MNETNRSIFRKEAIEQYIREQENKVLPKFVSTRLFLFIWAVFGVLSCLGLWLCFAEVPLFVSGWGVIVGQEEWDSCKGTETCIVAFFPPGIHSRLVAGKSLMIRTKDSRLGPKRMIVIVESEVLSPANIRKRYHPKMGGKPLPTQTSAVTLCRLNDPTHDMGNDLFSEEAFEVRIDAGTRRIASFLPVLDRFFSQSARP